MKSIYDFIVKPVGERYDNSIKVGDKSLIVNTKIESWKFVNNIAEVVAIPLAYKTDIKVGDTVVIHHNVFRRFYDIRGKQKDSRSLFKDNLYFCAADQIYLYKNNKVLIKCNGADAENFLNTQFTNDIKNLNKEQIILSGYCNPKGRLISIFYIFQIDKNFLPDFYHCYNVILVA